MPCYPTIIDGRMVAAISALELKKRVARFERQSPDLVPPTLAIVSFGENTSSAKYIQKKQEKGEELGMRILPFHFSDYKDWGVVKSNILWLNGMSSMHGIIIQHPITPRYMGREQELFDLIDPLKDVDGLTSTSQGRLFTNEPGFRSSTAKGIERLLDLHTSVSGKSIAIIGASNIVGKPLAVMLMNKGASVSVFQKSSRLEDIVTVCQDADIIISACGVPHYIEPPMMKVGSVLIDAGYTDGVGDIHPDCYPFSSFYTPVPGGVGPMTIITLLEQTVDAAERTLV